MKNKKAIITCIVLLIIAIIGLTYFFINMLNGKYKSVFLNFNHKTSTNLVLDEVYDSTLSEINVRSYMGDVYIKQSTSGEIKAVIYSENKATAEVYNNGLVIELAKEKCNFGCIGKKASKVEIYLPSDYNQVINIDNDYGNVYVAEFVNAEINAEADCGNINIIAGKNVNIVNNYGDINLKKAQKAEVTEDCGDIKIGEVFDIKAKNAYGDIEIDYVNNYLDIENNCGDIEIDNININENSQIKNDLGDIEIGQTNEIYIDAKTDLGDVDIRNNYNKSDIILKIKNSCGDIEVEN